MSGIEFLRITVLVVFSLNGLLALTLIVWKAVHRRRQKGYERRRVAYLTLLSRHLADPDEDLGMSPMVAEDQAFLDALIDIRTSVTGAESDALAEVIGSYGVMDRYARRLGSRHFRIRRLRAAVALAEVADSSRSGVLMKALDDHDPEVRIQAARGLGRMKWTPAIDKIVDRFSIETPWVRARFSDTLIGFGQKATWPLVAYVKVNHRFETAGPTAAIRTLGTIGDQDAARPMVEILEQAFHLEIQLPTIETLGVLGAPIAVPHLEALMDAEDWRLRAKAAGALGDIRDVSAVDRLALGLTDRNWWVRRNSAAALGKIPGGVRLLYHAISSADPFARDAAAEALYDAGELIAARRRVDQGEATPNDLALIRLIAQEEVLAS